MVAQWRDTIGGCLTLSWLHNVVTNRWFLNQCMVAQYGDVLHSCSLMFKASQCREDIGGCNMLAWYWIGVKINCIRDLEADLSTPSISLTFGPKIKKKLIKENMDTIFILL